jgi:hypothetical protein
VVGSGSRWASRKASTLRNRPPSTSSGLRATRARGRRPDAGAGRATVLIGLGPRRGPGGLPGRAALDRSRTLAGQARGYRSARCAAARRPQVESGCADHLAHGLIFSTVERPAVMTRTTRSAHSVR